MNYKEYAEQRAKLSLISDAKSREQATSAVEIEWLCSQIDGHLSNLAPNLDQIEFLNTREGIQTLKYFADKILQTFPEYSRKNILQNPLK